MHRRTYLGGAVSVAATVPLAGCGLIQPDPEIVSADASQSFTGAFTGTVDFEIEVVNNGQSGDVEVEIVFEDGSGTVVGRETKRVSMDSDERRRVTISARVPNGAERYNVETGTA